MTLRMYADRKGWPLQRTRVSIAHEKTRDAESGDPVDRFDRELVLDGPLDEVQTARLLEIADMCPVHRTLHGQVAVTTRLVPGF